MGECKHEWYFNKENGMYKCKNPKCRVGIGVIVAADWLNEHSALKRENKRYSAALYDTENLGLCRENKMLADITFDDELGIALLTAEEQEDKSREGPNE